MEKGMHASEALKKNLKIYSEHLIKDKYPSLIDGLKAIHRRILYVSKDDISQTQISTITGRLVEKYHSAGNISIGEAIRRMAQPFNNNFPLMESDGNIGGYGKSTESAAPRYLKIGMSEFASDIYFKGIDLRTLKFVPTETETTVEPAYFIPKLPMGLLTNSFAMGIGYRSVIPALCFEELCNLTISFIENDFKILPSLYKNLVPDFPIELYIRNRKELISKYSNTNYQIPILTDGTMIIHPNKIILRTIPVGQTFVKNCDSNLKNIFSIKGSYLNKYVSRIANYSKSRFFGDTIIDLKRGVDPFIILEQLKKDIGFSMKFYPSYYFSTDKGKQTPANHFNILYFWLMERKKSIIGALNGKQNSLIFSNRNAQATIIALENKKVFTRVFENANSIEDTLDYLTKKFKLSKSQVRYIAKDFNLEKLTKTGVDQLRETISSNKESLKKLQWDYSHTDERIKLDIEGLKKKYKSYKRKSKFNNFIGCMKGDRGVIQFRDMEEFKTLLKSFKNSGYSFNLYPTKSVKKYILNDNRVITEDIVDHPKEFSCEDFITSKDKLRHTISISHVGILRVDGLKFRNELKDSIFHIGDTFMSVDKTGNVDWGVYSQIPIKRGFSYDGAKSNIIYITTITSEEVVIFHVNSKELNTLRVSRVKKNEKLKMLKPPGVIVKILAAVPISESVMVNIPTDLVSKSKNRFLFFENLHSLIPKSNIKIDLKKANFPIK